MKAVTVQGVRAVLASPWWDMGGGELSRSKYRCPVSALGSVVGLIPLPPLCGPCREVGTSRGYRHPSPRSCLRLDGSLKVHLFALHVRQGAKSGLDPMLASQLQPGSQPIGKHGSWSSPRSKGCPIPSRRLENCRVWALRGSPACAELHAGSARCLQRVAMPC